MSLEPKPNCTTTLGSFLPDGTKIALHSKIFPLPAIYFKRSDVTPGPQSRFTQPAPTRFPLHSKPKALLSGTLSPNVSGGHPGTQRASNILLPVPKVSDQISSEVPRASVPSYWD